MNKVPITQEEFVSYINELKIIEESSNRLNDALMAYDECSDFSGFSNIRVTCLIIELLEKLFNEKKDEYGYSIISYFIEELEFGTKWTPECFQEADGTPIDISTSEKLYQYLVENYES